MSGSSFDFIAQELLKQKQAMEQIEEENRELHRQLVELREGYGVFVVIDGHRFSLSKEDASLTQMPTIGVVPVLTASSTTVELEPQAEPTGQFHDVTQDQTEELVMSVPETPRITVDFLQEDMEVAEQTAGPTFLEEAMIDEFASAATSPLSVWPAPKQEQEQTLVANEDEELATLRRQLIGSYLLE